MSKDGKMRLRNGICRKAAGRAAAMAGPHGAIGVVVVFVYEGGTTSASMATCNGMTDTRRKVKKGAEYALSRFDLEDGVDALSDFSRTRGGPFAENCGGRSAT